jgi:membrane associated rhomboid family serine protease
VNQTSETTGDLTPVVRNLLILNVLVFGLQHLVADQLVTQFALWPLGRHFIGGLGVVQFEPWQLVSYAFLHGGVAHIGLNMFALYSFGTMVERAVGSRRFMVLYFASVLTAALVQLWVVTAMLERGAVPTVGASGGVFGVLLAFAFLFPHARVMLVFPPIPMRAWMLVVGYALIELTSGVFGRAQGVAHFAHLGGMVGAIVTLGWWRYTARGGPQA